MTTTITSTAAHALAAALPTTVTLTPVLRTGGGQPVGNVSQAVTASFVGSPSADFAVVLIDDKAISAAIAGDAAAALTAADVLLPAIDAAASAVGNGVLGAATVGDAGSLFNDKNTAVFELLNKGEVAGWFAIRIRTSNHAEPTEFVASKLGRINSVEMSLTVEIGRTRMNIRDVLALEPGAVIELDRSAGAPADILLNGRLIAHGEIVVVDQDYAVRVTKILDVLDGTV